MDELSCEVVQNLLPSYVDGLTGPTVAQALQAHLDSCPSCRESFDRMSWQLPSTSDHEQDKAVAYLRRKRRFALLRRVLLILAGAAALGGLIWLGVTVWILSHARSVDAPHELPLAAPAIYVKDAKLSCTRETTLSFLETHPTTGEKAQVVEILDRFVIRNDGEAEAVCTLAVPNVPQPASGIEPYFCLTVNGEICDGWYAPEEGPTELLDREKLIRGEYLSALLLDWDGVSLPPASEKHEGAPEAMEERGRSVPFLTYGFAPLRLAPGEEATVEIRLLRRNSHLVLSFPKVANAIPCSSHSLHVNNLERTEIRTQDLLDRKTLNAVKSNAKRLSKADALGLSLDITLDPNREDYEIEFVTYYPVNK